MARIPETTIAEIKARTDLRELVESYGISVKRAGSDYKCLCPFHHEKTPSFSLSSNSGHWHCFGCGEHGDVFQFVQRYEGLGFVDAVRRLAARCGIEIKETEEDEVSARKRKRLYALHAELALFFRRCLVQAKEGERARRYLQERHLDGDVAESFQIGYVPQAPSAMTRWASKHGFTNDDLADAGVMAKPQREDGRWYNRFAGRIAFPIRDRMGRTVAFSCRSLETDKEKMVGGKYVNSPETEIFKKSAVLYGLDKAGQNIIQSKGRVAIVCEGQIDVIRMHSCGFCTAVAAQGTAFTREHVRQLKRCADSALLLFDGDGAGRKAAVKAAALLMEAEIPVTAATLPSGEDPDSFLQRRGAQAMRDILDNAVSATSFLARSMMAKSESGGTGDAPAQEIKAHAAKATLELIGHCPSAVMREVLLEEASWIIGLSPAAMRSDLKNIAPRKANAKAKPMAAAAPPKAETDISASEVPLLERCLCLLLSENEGDETLAEGVNAILATRRITDFTRDFLTAWLDGLRGGEDALARCHETRDPKARLELDRILVAQAPGTMPTFSRDRILKDFMRVLPLVDGVAA